ncbi:hypothetical protein EV13_2875 [Prochlorococcus sp. MIT 0702]|nr:hypothetical protein EV12_2822 [Prochlorococcus sp. MIT 0701]KGG26096.1 hypothetical protein EV13_2875 [Prochlorococcus sp. MIT 0702]
MDAGGNDLKPIGNWLAMDALPLSRFSFLIKFIWSRRCKRG